MVREEARGAAPVLVMADCWCVGASSAPLGRFDESGCAERKNAAEPKPTSATAPHPAQPPAGLMKLTPLNRAGGAGQAASPPAEGTFAHAWEESELHRATTEAVDEAWAASYPRKGCQALARIIVSRWRHECSTRVV